MSDHDENIVEDDADSSIAGLRAVAKQGKEAMAENTTLKRQLLFARAGIDVQDDGIGEMLFRTWDGGDDLDALKVKALKVGALSAPGTTNTRDTPPDEDALRRQAQADFAPGVGQPGSGVAMDGPNPIDKALGDFHANRKAGMPQADAQHEAITQVIAAGMSGDKRARFDAQAHAAAAAEARAQRGY